MRLFKLSAAFICGQSYLSRRLRLVVTFATALLTTLRIAASGDAPPDQNAQLQDRLVLVEAFESDQIQAQLTGLASIVEGAPLAISGHRSLQLSEGGTAQTDPSTLTLKSDATYLLLLSYRIDETSSSGTSFAIRAIWEEDEVTTTFEISPIPDAAAGASGTSRRYFTFGDGTNPRFELAVANDATVTIDDLLIFERAATSGLKSPKHPRFGFPRLAKRLHLSPMSYAHRNGKTLATAFEELSRFDALIGFEGDATQGNDWHTPLRELNPQILLLPGIEAFSYPIEAKSAGASHAAGLWAETILPDWELALDDGTPISDASDPSSRLINSAGEGFSDYTQALVDHLGANVLDGGIFDGVVMMAADPYPNVQRLAPGGDFESLPAVDLDRDGNAETSSELIENWPLKFHGFFAKLRADLEQDGILLGSASQFPYFASDLASANGFAQTQAPYLLSGDSSWDVSGTALFEDQARSRTIARRSNQGAELLVTALDGSGLGVATGEDTPLGHADREKSLTAEDLRRMRFGLASSLLDDGYFSYDWVDASSPVLWFDEYAVSKDGVATNSRFGRGYLGQPIANSQRLEIDSQPGELLLLDFESEGPEELKLDAIVTSSPDETISGSNSLIVSLEDDATPKEFFRLPSDAVELEPDQTYEISLAFRVLDYAPDTLDPVFRFGFDGHAYQLELMPETIQLASGEIGTLSATFLVAGTDADLVGTIFEQAQVVIDDIAIRRAPGFFYRRDFENGIVLLNAHPTAVPLAQAQVTGPLNRIQPRRISGTQAPDVNDGSKVTTGLTLNAGDAVVLLADRLAAPRLEAPAPLAIDPATITETSIGFNPVGNPPPSLSHYVIEYGFTGGETADFQLVPARTPLQLSNLRPGSTYVAQLRAVDFSGRQSRASDPITFVTSGHLAARPQILSFSKDEAESGEAIMIQTSDLALSEAKDFTAPFPTEADGISVTFNGLPALLLRLTSDSVSVVVPDSLKNGERAIVRIHSSNTSSPARSIQITDPNQRSSGNVISAQLDETGANFELDSGASARVSIVADGTARIRFSPDGEFKDWTSGAVILEEDYREPVAITNNPANVRLETASISVVVSKNPFSVQTFDANGTILTDEHGLGASWRLDREEVTLQLQAPNSRKYFGLGLRGGPLNRRGERITLKNQDFAGYEEYDNPLYSSIPFFLAASDSTFHGVFADMPAQAFFDFDSGESETLTISAQQNEIDYYVFAGPLPTQVMSGYHRLTGEAPLPPLWAMGYHQSRYGYYSWDVVEAVTSTLRSQEIPCDAVYLDIDWMDNYEPFTWNDANFPNPTSRLQPLANDGFRIVTIVDPFVPKHGPTWDELSADGLLLKGKDGEPFHSSIFLGDVGWLDFSNPATADWYREGLSGLLNVGVSGIWNDLNEPADNFLTDAVFDYSGQNLSEIQSRNIFALTEIRETYDAMRASRMNERPFILTRSGYSGFHRYAAMWSGDTNSSFDALRVSVQTSLHMSLSGTPFFGHDIGGFLGSPTPELFIRWLAFSSYTPFFRNHAHRIADLREPWQFGPPYTNIARSLIEERYRMLPYWYSLFDQAKTDGSATLGPTFTRFPYDPNTFDQTLEFMVGPYLLVAPVVEPGAATRSLYLPSGHAWYDRRTNQRFDGGQTITVPAPLEQIPVFARSDAIIPSGPVRQHTGQEIDRENITFDIFPDAGDGFTLYEDDGISYEYESGNYLRTRVTKTSDSLRLQVHFSYEGNWDPGERDVWVNLHESDSAARFVVIDGTLYSSSSSAKDLFESSHGWHRSEETGILSIKTQQGVGSLSVLFDRPAAGKNPHLFYLDRDGDLQGDANDAFIIYTDAALFGLVSTSGDPDDLSFETYQPMVPQGGRRLGASVSDIQSSRFPDLGIEVATVNLSWKSIEPEPLSYLESAFGELTTALTLAPADWPIRISLPVVDETGLQRPDHLDATPLDDAAVAIHYKLLLDEIDSRLQGRAVHSLSIGSAVASGLTPAEREAFLAFASEAASYAKSLWGTDLPVGVDLYIEAATDPEIEPFLKQLKVRLDWIGLRFSPWPNDPAVAFSPTLFKQSVERIISLHPETTFQIPDLSFPSSTDSFSSEMKQVFFIRDLFSLWDQHAEQIPFVSFRRITDSTLLAAQVERLGSNRFRDAGELAFAVENSIASSGLIRLDSTVKPSYASVRNATFERGWDILQKRDRRTVRLGLTTDPYDMDPGAENPSAPFIDEVMDEIFRVAHESGEMIEYHFDKGVPWLEALSDTFESAELPYSQNVRSHWHALKSRESEGLESIVSINPLGLPRKRLAAYWGYGEGFYHDENGDRVPNGIYQDYNQRIPPGLWANRKLNHPATKDAYLNYAKRAIDYFQPEYLNIAVEANEAIDGGEQAFAEYLELQAYVYNGLKSQPDYADVKIVITFSVEFLMRDELGVPYLLAAKQDPTLTDKHFGMLQSLLPYTDVVGLSLHPIKIRWPRDVLPIEGFARLFRELRQLTNLPLAVTETGYPADSFSIGGTRYESSADKQKLYMEMLFALAERSGGFDFIINYGARDFTPQLDKLRERAKEDPPFTSPSLTEFFKIFESIGLYEENGDSRPMTEAWLKYLTLPLDGTQTPTRTLSLYSPSAKVRAVVGIDGSDQLYYTVYRDGAQALGRSSIGIDVDDYFLGKDAVGLTLVESREIDETYPTLGAFATQRNHCLEFTLRIEHERSDSPDLFTQFRVSDDGVAYRYQIPETLESPTVRGESSSWNFSDGSFVWFQNSTGNYESQYRQLALGLLNEDVGGQVLVESPSTGHFLLASEAALRAYSGLTLRAEFLSTTLRSTFLDDETWPADPGQWTPWRYTITVLGLDQLVGSPMVSNLNEAPDAGLFPDGALTKWIRPGKALWSWWSDQDSGANFELQKRFVDAAAANGIDYVVVDIHWEDGFATESQSAFERLAKLVEYARSDGRSVGIWVWKDFAEATDEAKRTAFLDAVKTSGVVGIKYDLVYGSDSESYANVVLHERILHEAAERELMINFHGTHKANGLHRTYPNEITREGFSGLENNGLLWEKSPEFLIPPSHNATIPFARMVAGPGDYTPVTFDSRKTGQTTFAHQLAMAGLSLSPLTHYADSPDVLFSEETAADLLSHLPTVWDETRSLPGSDLGRSAALARRKGADWWIFAVNGSADQPFSAGDFDLGFLQADASYWATIVTDAAQHELAREDVSGITRDSAIPFDLLPGGGVVVRLAEEQSYERWTKRHPNGATLLSDRYADTDGDGASNLLEYAFGSDPLTFESNLSSLIQVAWLPSSEWLQLDVAGWDNSSSWADISLSNWEDPLKGLSIHLESSNDGENWHPFEPTALPSFPYRDGQGRIRQPVLAPLESIGTGSSFFRLSIRDLDR